MKIFAAAMVLLAAPLLLTGCMSTDPGPAFSDVQRTVQARTGQKIAWRQNSQEDREADAAVSRILQRKMTVNDAVQVALLNNPSLQATYEEIGISQADLVQAGLLKNPEFANVSRFPDRGPGAADIEISVVQDFLDLFTLPLRKKVAAAQLEQTKLEVGNAVLDLVADVKQAYYTLQGRQQLRHGLELVLDINEAGADFAHQQNQAGTLNELDTEKQTVLFTQGKADLAQVRVEIDSDRERLNRLLGLSGSQLDWTIAGELPTVPARQFPDDKLQSLAMTQRLDIAAARAQVEKIRQALGYTKATSLAPGGINIGGDTERNPDGSRVSGPVIDLQVPIFDQGQAQVAKAQDQLRQAQAQLDAAEVNARSEVREANHRLQAAQELARLYSQTLLPQRRKIVALAQQQYNYMLKGAYDLLEAKQHEIEAERATIEATRDYWVARAALERSVGGSLNPALLHSDKNTVASTPAPTQE